MVQMVIIIFIMQLFLILDFSAGMYKVKNLLKDIKTEFEREGTKTPLSKVLKDLENKECMLCLLGEFKPSKCKVLKVDETFIEVLYENNENKIFRVSEIEYIKQIDIKKENN